MLYFSHDYFDTQCIYFMPDGVLNGKGDKMTQERANYRIPLAGNFERVFQRVTSAPTGEPGRILAGFAASLVNGEEFNLAQIEQLPDEADRLLCLALFEYCMTEGLTEDERREASDAFAPFLEIHKSGARH